MTCSELMERMMSGGRLTASKLTQNFGDEWHEPMRHLHELKLAQHYLKAGDTCFYMVRR